MGKKAMMKKGGMMHSGAMKEAHDRQARHVNPPQGANRPGRTAAGAVFFQRSFCLSSTDWMNDAFAAV